MRRVRPANTGICWDAAYDFELPLHRLLHDEASRADREERAWAQEAEAALLAGEEEPDSPGFSVRMAAEAFRGFTAELCPQGHGGACRRI